MEFMEDLNRKKSQKGKESSQFKISQPSNDCTPITSYTYESLHKVWLYTRVRTGWPIFGYTEGREQNLTIQEIHIIHMSIEWDRKSSPKEELLLRRKRKVTSNLDMENGIKHELHQHTIHTVKWPIWILPSH